MTRRPLADHVTAWAAIAFVCYAAGHAFAWYLAHGRAP